jgi:hypothetical protein
VSWILKITSSKDGSPTEVLHQCDSFEVTRFLPGTLARKDLAESNNLTPEELDSAGLGILIRMFNHRDGRRCIDRTDLWLPRDGEHIHVLDPDTGKIVSGYRWTPRGKKEQPQGVATPPPQTPTKPQR